MTVNLRPYRSASADMYARSALCAGAVLRTDGPPTLKKFLGGFPNTAACLVWKRNSPIGIFGDGDFRGRGFSGTGGSGTGGSALETEIGSRMWAVSWSPRASCKSGFVVAVENNVFGLR